MRWLIRRGNSFHGDRGRARGRRQTGVRTRDHRGGLTQGRGREYVIVLAPSIRPPLPLLLERDLRRSARVHAVEEQPRRTRPVFGADAQRDQRPAIRVAVVRIAVDGVSVAAVPVWFVQPAIARGAGGIGRYIDEQHFGRNRVPAHQLIDAVVAGAVEILDRSGEWPIRRVGDHRDRQALVVADSVGGAIPGDEIDLILAHAQIAAIDVGVRDPARGVGGGIRSWLSQGVVDIGVNGSGGRRDGQRRGRSARQRDGAVPPVPTRPDQAEYSRESHPGIVPGRGLPCVSASTNLPCERRADIECGNGDDWRCLEALARGQSRDQGREIARLLLPQAYAGSHPRA